MTTAAQVTPISAPSPTLARRPISWEWLGVVPFFAFAIAFLLLPSIFLFVGSFQNNDGLFTLQNFGDLAQPGIFDAYWLSIQISLVTAVAGGVIGFMLAYATILGGLPRWVRTALMTFSGVASNFAGVPLAFAFIATLGRTGFITALMRDAGFDIYSAGFSLYSFAGLCLTYIYFQLPLMVLIIAPALDGLKREWREASENLGASSWQYWRYVALPVLFPSLLGTMILLFGNAFGAYATAFALTGGTFGLATILIGRQIRGDVLQNPGLGYAVAIGMIVIMGLSILVYTWLQRRTARWLQ
jgi:putative spermidine/putrescine transport system permease protein